MNLQPDFQKGEGFDRTSTFRGDLLGKRGVTLFGWGRGAGCNFHIKINQNIKI